ncbi:hypothetical protein acsn021_34140 [Anaerocolumna cellulosilytica]|uniref:Uncharacterized protein n=1 Tax=Anaerocolumna cellulosilytica TaxID=433286 RepID=A0A6S6R9M8_9FIRM|nr:nitroreductase family protein [Anaerocolumna cellulosilytica]MBB5196761.1 nitroreductase [Anaerocolumna cellulosilytica]BCJ95845.1 hypothetical protein acsn021_34140 [Anaerocolumna cellulosilytica]
MNLYEAIFVRKTIRKFHMDSLDKVLLNNIITFAESIPMLFEGINVEYKLLEHKDIKHYFNGNITVKSPYYLSLYSDKTSGYQMNAGFVIQQIALYLTAKGLGSCYLGRLKAKKSVFDESLKEKEHVITLAFGEGEHEIYRQSDRIKRLPLTDIAIIKSEIGKNVKTMVSAARLAPSSMNSQPWRLVVYDNRIHVFCKRNIFLQGILSELKLIDIGICLAHLVVAAEELWLNVRVVKVDNINNLSFKKNDYIISLLL